MPVKGDRLPVDPKDAGHVRMERSLSNERLDRGAPLEMRIDGDQRLGPKAPARVDCVNLISDILGADLGERASKARVISYKRSIQIKDIHDCSFLLRCLRMLSNYRQFLVRRCTTELVFPRARVRSPVYQAASSASFFRGFLVAPRCPASRDCVLRYEKRPEPIRLNK